MSGGSFDLSWDTIDGGGVTFATGGIMSLGGTIGQPDAAVMGGGSYSLAGGFWQGGDLVSGVGDDLPDSPGDAQQGSHVAFRLYPAAPNPSRATAGIAFDLPEARPVRLVIYNLQGARVATLADGGMAAGHHVVQWDGTDCKGSPAASGIYLVRLESGSMRQEEKVVVLR
jgi:hypothetical protein